MDASPRPPPPIQPPALLLPLALVALPWRELGAEEPATAKAFSMTAAIKAGWSSGAITLCAWGCWWEQAG